MNTLLLLQEEAAEPSLFGWYLGFIIGFSVIVVVVVIVASILTLASRIGRQTQSAIAALESGHANTLPLWELRKTNDSARGILEAARGLRRTLEEG